MSLTTNLPNVLDRLCTAIDETGTQKTVLHKEELRSALNMSTASMNNYYYTALEFGAVEREATNISDLSYSDDLKRIKEIRARREQERVEEIRIIYSMFLKNKYCRLIATKFGNRLPRVGQIAMLLQESGVGMNAAALNYANNYILTVKYLRELGIKNFADVVIEAIDVDNNETSSSSIKVKGDAAKRGNRTARPKAVFKTVRELSALEKVELQDIENQIEALNDQILKDRNLLRELKKAYEQKLSDIELRIAMNSDKRDELIRKQQELIYA